MGRIFKYGFLFFVIAFIGIQFIDVDKTNPEVTADIQAPPEVKKILRSSCYDCHSNETRWPFYSNIAPISWFIADDVNEGRENLNFSNWEKLYSEKQDELKRKIWKEINEDEMPMSTYIYMHPDAKLGLPQKDIIKKWATGEDFFNLDFKRRLK
ncbi:MAG: heme-binding domain-containing protein [Bacteroidetes bacterium]|nr:heme-binding domain-containing protein [Bacteroidota bacterium]